jgi:hypothetical protein
MAQKLNPAERVEFKELLMAKLIQTNGLAQLFIKKDIICTQR